MKKLGLLLLLLNFFAFSDVNAQCASNFFYNSASCPDIQFYDASSVSSGSITSWNYDFGDGATSTGEFPLHTFTANGTYLVCLSITTSDSCTSTFCDTVIISCILPVSCNAFYQYTLGACPSVSFFDGSTSNPGSITSWSYDFGDGGTSSLQNPSHAYAANGTYLACLTITTSDSCTSTFCDTINIGCILPPGCNADFAYTMAGCPSISFFDASTSSPGSIISWSYDFGDGGTSSLQNPSHAYTANGTYLACLTITTSDSCTSTFCDTLVITCITAPSCNATFSYTVGACPAITFFDLSTSSPGSIISWDYSFGDGGTSSLQNPTHTYAANGSYVVCLTITTSDSCTSTFCDTLVITCITAPSCNAQFSYTVGACPAITFFDLSSSSPGSIISWDYSFGDGGTSSIQNPTHTYAANGSYLVCLTITTSDSCTSTFCDTVNIGCVLPVSCNANFGYTMGLCPDILFFDSSISSPGTITSWNYDFGDGGSSSLQNPSHTYTANGTYLACLTITTSDSCTSTFCDTLVITCITAPSCNAAFSYTMAGCPSISFFDASTSSPGSIISWDYDFGDGGSSSLQNPTHTYTANGSYLVCLTITTSDSCTSTFCDTVLINCISAVSCNALFSTDISGCPDVVFTDGSTASPGSVTDWMYDFGDGNSSTLQNPTHTYLADGLYLVCLTITTSDSCTSTFCDSVLINCNAGLGDLNLTKFTLQPNPAQNEFSVILENSSSIKYRIVTYMGAIMDEGTRGTAVQHHFDITTLAQGAYLLEVEIDGVRNVVRFIKQ